MFLFQAIIFLKCVTILKEMPVIVACFLGKQGHGSFFSLTQHLGTWDNETGATFLPTQGPVRRRCSAMLGVVSVC